MVEMLLDLFFPRPHFECVSATNPVILETQDLRALHLESIDRIVAAMDYHQSDRLKEIIHRFKYSGIRALRSNLSEMIVSASQLIDDTEKPTLCAVPLHWTRKFQRGFNQADFLADAISKKRGWEVMQLLKRTRPTGHQAWRKKKERFEAMENAFVFRGSIVPSCVLLIDDLSTTGATMDACAKALKQAGVKRVEGLVVAHG